MIPGLNHNVRFKERLFHVQTEDSGLERPVLMTHVFIEGTIIATERSDYGALIERVGDQAELRTIVRKEMQEQHKLCIKNLLRGVYDPVIAGILPELAGPPVEGPPIPPARRSAPPIPEPRKSAVPEPTGGAHLTNPGRGPSTLSPADEAAPTERPRASQPSPQFDELEVHLLDPSAFADEDEILASLDMLPPLPDTIRPDRSSPDTLLDLPAFDFAEDDPIGTLPPLGPPDAVFDTERPERPSAPTMPPDAPRSSIKTTPAPASNRPRFERPQTRPPHPKLEPSQRPSQRAPAPVVWTKETPPSFWPENPEPRATQEVSVAFPPEYGATRKDPPALDLRRTSPELRATKKTSDLPPMPAGFQAPRAPASWPPPAELEDMKTLPPDAEVPDFLLHRGRPSDKPSKSSTHRPIRVEETSLDEIITGYLDKGEE